MAIKVKHYTNSQDPYETTRIQWKIGRFCFWFTCFFRFLFHQQCVPPLWMLLGMHGFRVQFGAICIFLGATGIHRAQSNLRFGTSPFDGRLATFVTFAAGAPPRTWRFTGAKPRNSKKQDDKKRTNKHSNMDLFR